MPTCYIAAPYELREVARDLRGGLQAMGITVVARWLDVAAQDSDGAAREDLEDIDASDAVVLLNPSGWARRGTGGRHVEFGYALAQGKRLVILGDRTNVFHLHSDVRCVASVCDVRGALL
jgi:nucleoside 2-deoxyribosyltransferase